MIDRWIDPDEEIETFESQEDDSDEISPDMISEAELRYECRIFRESFDR